MKLKTIIENAGIGGFGEQPQKMTPEQKRNLLELVGKYNECGKTLYGYEDVRQIAESILKVTELAEKYALDECDEDWMGAGIVSKDMKEIRKEASEMHKIAKEAWTANERLKACYENIGNKLSRYYEIN
jgi:hypothetical protein